VQRSTRKTLLGVALTLIGLLLSATVVFIQTSTSCHFPDTPKHRAESGARIWRTAAQFWQIDTGSTRCPTVAELRAARSVDPEVSALDPWGRPYRIECGAEGIVIRSSGKDHTLNTTDDVTVPHARSSS